MRYVVKPLEVLPRVCESGSMKKEDAVRFAGTAKRLAEILGISPPAVSMWGDEIPQLQMYRLKELRPRWFTRLKQEAKEAQQ